MKVEIDALKLPHRDWDDREPVTLTLAPDEDPARLVLQVAGEAFTVDAGQLRVAVVAAWTREQS